MASAISEHGERRQYRNPPIVEALCDVQFETRPDELDMALPGRLLDRLTLEYSGGTTKMRPVGWSVPEPPQGAPALVERVGIKSEVGDRAITLAPGMIGIHMYPPYRGWEAFLAQIEDALSALLGVVPDGQVSTIGIRYSNSIEIPEISFDPTHYFNLALSTAEQLPDVFVSIRQDVSYFVDENTRFNLFFDSRGDGEFPVFGLDLEVRRFYERQSDLPFILTEISQLRALERVYFEALITDALRELFDAS